MEAPGQRAVEDQPTTAGARDTDEIGRPPIANPNPHPRGMGLTPDLVVTPESGRKGASSLPAFAPALATSHLPEGDRVGQVGPDGPLKLKAARGLSQPPPPYAAAPFESLPTFPPELRRIWTLRCFFVKGRSSTGHPETA